MNPKRRRLLIPGLLAALIVVVVIQALLQRAEAAEPDEEVSQLADERISESSGLVYSRDHDDLAYTINDSGHAAEIFAIRPSTGETVAVTRLTTPWLDAEALALYDGTLWVADTGDNNRVRPSVKLLALDEPGPVDGQVTPREVEVRLPDGPRDIEALAIHPRDGRFFLISKKLGAGEVLALGKNPRGSVEAKTRKLKAPALVTDATFSHDGSALVTVSYLALTAVEFPSGTPLATSPMTGAGQVETLAVEPFGWGSVVYGSEGVQSTLKRRSVPEISPVVRSVAAGGALSKTQPGDKPASKN